VGDDGERTRNELSGDTGPVVQAGSVHGGIHYHASDARDFLQPHQLPPATGGFVDRVSSVGQLDLVLAAWASDSEADSPKTSAVVAITGAPGVGKTALALHWAHRNRDSFADGDLYIDMRGYGSVAPLSVEQALDSFLRSLDIDPDRIPVDLNERAALYRSLLGNRRILILIDNVSSVRQIRHLLPGSRHCLAIITSRSRLSSLVTLEGATRVDLDVLTPDDAVRLLAEFIGEERIEADLDAANLVATLCSRLPLALRVVAERAAARPHLTMRELARELASEQGRLDALASEEDELTNVRAVFSWSYRALRPEQQKVFRLVGLHAGAEFGVAAAAALVDVPVQVAGRQLQDLANAHLVQEVAPERYRLHDLLRAYSLERVNREEPQRERTHAVRRLFGWYLLATDAARQVILPYSHSIPVMPPGEVPAPVFENVQDAVAWYEAERLNLLAVIQHALDLGQYDIAWKLPVVSDGFFELRSYWIEWKQIHVDGLLAAQATVDRLGEASNLLSLGDASWRIGTHDEALGYYERSAAIAGEIGDEWIAGFAMRGIGLIHQERQDFAASLDYFTRALGIFRENGLQRGEGMSLLSLGKVRLELGDFDEAIDYSDSAVAIFTAIGDSWSRAWGLIPLIDATVETGRTDLAEQYARDALATFRSFADRHSEALVLHSLGVIFGKRGDDVAARAFLVSALEIAEQLDERLADRISARISAVDER
jgi:tetratricopeptide (TPR) repeat protein